MRIFSRNKICSIYTLLFKSFAPLSLKNKTQPQSFTPPLIIKSFLQLLQYVKNCRWNSKCLR